MDGAPKYSIVKADPKRRKAKPRAEECSKSQTWDEFDGLTEKQRRALAIEIGQANILRAMRLTEKTWKGLQRHCDEDTALANIAALGAMGEAMKTMAQVAIMTFGDPAALAPAKKPSRIEVVIETVAAPDRPPVPKVDDDLGEPPPLHIVRPDEERDEIMDEIERLVNE